MPTIAVLVKHVPDSWSERRLADDFTLDRAGVDEVIDEINEHAMEQALRIKEADPGRGWEIVALSLGSERADAAVRKAIAMGADRGVLVTDSQVAGSDALATAWALHCALQAVGEFDLIVAGNASSDGSMGVVGPILAEYRDIPALTHLDRFTVEGDTVHGTRVTADGSAEVHATLPALITVTEQSGKARFPNFKGIMAAKKATVTVLDAEAAGIDPETVGLDRAATAVTAATKRPDRTRGDILTGLGGEDAAKAIADYLEAERLL